jgi:hypothetical protein
LHNKNAIGEGVDLPEDQGGISCSLPTRYRSRIHIQTQDITRYNLHPNKGVPNNDPYPSPPFSDTKFNLVLLHAHRRSDTLKSNREPERMLLSQLILAFDYTAIDGIVVMRLGHPERDRTAAILYILGLLFEHVDVHKPMKSHEDRKTFYAVATGFQSHEVNNPEELYQITNILRNSWWEATFGGEDGKGTKLGEWWEEIVNTEQLPELFGTRLIQLALPVWKRQIQGLKRYFKKKRIGY